MVEAQLIGFGVEPDCLYWGIRAQWLNSNPRRFCSGQHTGAPHSFWCARGATIWVELRGRIIPNFKSWTILDRPICEVAP